MNGYELSRNWFDWCFENPEKVTPNHTALYFFAIEHCNRLGWREKFGFPTEMAKEAIGIKSYNTYIKTLNNLVEWGFIEMIQRSKNQFSANIIALSNFDKALDKALDKAIINHMTKQSESTIQSNDSINKQQTKKYNTPAKADDVFDFNRYLETINEKFGRSFKVVNDKTKKQIKARLKEKYTKQDIIDAINNCKESDFHKDNGYRYCTPEFFSRADILDRWSDVSKLKEKKVNIEL